MQDERLLDSSDDDFEEEAPKPKRENSTVRQMREKIDSTESALRQAEERAAKAEAAILGTSGLSEKQQEVFKAAGYGIDQIDTFRAEVLGVADTPAETEEPPAAEEDESADITPEQAGFVPTRQGGQTPSAREYTSQDIVELMQTDPAKADKILRSGKVVRKEFHPGGPRF